MSDLGGTGTAHMAIGSPYIPPAASHIEQAVERPKKVMACPPKPASDKSAPPTPKEPPKISSKTALTTRVVPNQSSDAVEASLRAQIRAENNLLTPKKFRFSKNSTYNQRTADRRNDKIKGITRATEFRRKCHSVSSARIEAQKNKEARSDRTPKSEPAMLPPAIPITALKNSGASDYSALNRGHIEVINTFNSEKESNTGLDSRSALNSGYNYVLPFTDPKYFIAPLFPESNYGDDGRKKKDKLREAEIAELYRTCQNLGIPQESQAEFVGDFLIKKDKLTRPKWADRSSHPDDLCKLSAPNFLKRVHADYIEPDGTVYNEIIREIDWDLMKAIEVYMSQRRHRGIDAGDAKGLNFILARPRAISKINHTQAKPS